MEDGKLGLAGVIALEDLQDPERNCELLSSLRRNASQRRSQRRGGSPLPSSGSEQDVNDGVFLMVYLPPPYEQTLTRIARAASMSSRDGDVPPSPSLDPPHIPELEPPPPGQGPDTPPSHGLDPPPSPGVDPPPSPGPLMTFSPGRETGVHNVDEIRED